MNHVQSNPIDCRGQSSPSKWGWLSDKLGGRGGDSLLDAFRFLHPHTPGHTRFSGNKSSRLDYVLLSPSLRHMLPISTAGVGTSPLTSDHYPVEFSFRVTGFQPPVTVINGGLRMKELSTADR